MRILGISCYYHDAAAALLADGQLMAAAEEERFSRKKHDFGFPKRAIDFCLRQAGMRDARELDYVVFYEKPIVKFERVLKTTLATYPLGWRVFAEAMQAWFHEKLWIRGTIVRHLGVEAGRILFVDHHMSHAASAFLCSPFNSAAVLTVDGVGEWTTAALGRASGAPDGRSECRIELDHEIRFPHSLGLLYSAFTAFLGFEVNEGEYKVMGMAPYGEPRYVDKVRKLIDLSEDGSFRLDMRYFAYHRSTEYSYSPRFLELFGEPRPPGADFYTLRTHPKRDFPGWDEASARSNQTFADIAASIQRVTEEVLLSMAREAHRRTGERNLVMAGGVALNSGANGRILAEGPFEQLFIQPAAGDAGGALGAALYAHHILLGRPRGFVLQTAYWGEGYAAETVGDFLRGQGVSHEEVTREEELTDRIVEALLAGKVIGFFQGRFEWGPRALGNRSILADPRPAHMKDLVNRKIKFREPFRPFAPVVPVDRAAQFFPLPYPADNFPARFMQLVLPLHEDKRERLLAVNHMGTARPQTIEREHNPLYHGLIEKFGEATGVPVLLNTSFNLRGEPMVSSPADALRTFGTSGIDLLVMDHFVVTKRDGDER